MKADSVRLAQIRSRLSLVTMADSPPFDFGDCKVARSDPDDPRVHLWGPDGDLLAEVYGNTAYRIGEEALAEVYAHAVTDLLLLMHIAEAAAAFTAPYVEGKLPEIRDGKLWANWLWLDKGDLDHPQNRHLLDLCRAIYSDDPILFEEQPTPDNASTQPVAGLPLMPNGERAYDGGPLSDHPQALAAQLYENAVRYADGTFKSLLLSAANYVTNSEATKADIRTTIEASLQKLDMLDDPTKPMEAKS